MQENEIQNLICNISKEDLDRLNTYYNAYLSEKKSIENVQKRLHTCETDKRRKPKPTEKEENIKENLHLARILPRRKKHVRAGQIIGRNKIDSLSIDGQEFNTSSLDQVDYLKLFFKIKKDKSYEKYNYLILALVSIVTAINLAGFSLTLGNNILAIISLLLFSVGAVSTSKHTKSGHTVIKVVPKASVSQGKINEFKKLLRADLTNEKQHSLEMHANNLAFTESIEDICKNRIELHQTKLNEIINQIMSILENYGVGQINEDLSVVKQAITQGRQKQFKS